MGDIWVEKFGIGLVSHWRRFELFVSWQCCPCLPIPWQTWRLISSGKWHLTSTNSSFQTTSSCRRQLMKVSNRHLSNSNLLHQKFSTMYAILHMVIVTCPWDSSLSRREPWLNSALFRSKTGSALWTFSSVIFSIHSCLRGLSWPPNYGPTRVA